MKLEMECLEESSVVLSVTSEACDLKDCMKEAIAFSVMNECDASFEYEGYEYRVSYDSLMECVISQA